jgi:hypothetical protein
MHDAVAAARRAAHAAGFVVDEPPVPLPGVADTVLHFPSAAVVAKVAVRERFREAALREHAIAVELAALNAPAPRPLVGIAPDVDSAPVVHG